MGNVKQKKECFDQFSKCVNDLSELTKGLVSAACWVIDKPNVYNVDLQVIEESIHSLNAANSLLLKQISILKRTLT